MDRHQLSDENQTINKAQVFIHWCTACFFLLSGVFITCTNSIAQTLQVNPSTVTVAPNNFFELNYVVDNANIRDFQSPDFGNFSLVSGPNRSTQMSMINGRTTMRSSISFTLQAGNKTGKYTIPAATAMLEGGGTVRSAAVKVQVDAKAPPSSSSSGAGRGRQQSPQNPFGQNWPPIFGTPPFSNPPATPPGATAPGQASPTTTITKKDIFLKIEIDTNTIYLGQQLAVKYRLYTKLDASNYQILAQPALNGFWVQETTPKVMQANNRVKIGNDTYTYYDLKKYIVFAQQAGNLNIAPMSATVDVRIPNPNSHSFFSLGYDSETVSLSSDSLQITVLPLPDINKPNNFTGGVGNFTVNTRLKATQIAANEPLDLLLTIQGTGNLPLIQAPTLELPKGIETFNPDASEQVFADADSLKGTRQFKYTLIPQSSGKINLPVLEFSYFDPQTKQYQTLRGDSITINVLPSKGTNEAANNDLTTLRPQRNTVIMGLQKVFLWQSAAFWLAWLLPFLVFGLWYKRQQYLIANQPDAATVRSNTATEKALKRLSAAKQQLAMANNNNNNDKTFYETLSLALLHFAADKLNLPVANLSAGKAANLLAQQGFDAQYINEWQQISQYCEMAIYAPVSSDQTTKQQIYEQAVELLTKMEKK
ncbi:MAG: protein BatD [Sphingobacteriales bacterium]|jgi:hypothetical protein|nr:protein BatD [Sphingobacteriales bacterium]MBP9140565.1 protein BatD [Chitinophagales bacterium]MDA0197255.1 BatD family protein [Bacteroidota bacterium]MBK6890365.1 protein BatD [Sphingobacteriales bacterium]MBK7526582.1 protein BatD [Sphingobacteriales bacterium]